MYRPILLTCYFLVYNLNLPFHSFCLNRRSASHPPLPKKVSNLLSYASVVTIESEGKVWSLGSRLGGVGERRELPQWGPGQSPGRKRILSIFQGHRAALVEGKMQHFLLHIFSETEHILNNSKAAFATL